MTAGPWIWTHLSFALIAASLGGKATKLACLLQGICAFAVGLIRIDGVDICGRLLPFTGSLSVGSVCVLCLAILHRMQPHTVPYTKAEQSATTKFWACAGTLLLASAMGFWKADVYAVGYLPSAAWVVLLGSLAAVFVRYRVFAIYLVVAVVAWQLRIVESANLWDYLLDPWLTIGSCMVVTRNCVWKGSRATKSDDLPKMAGTDS